jgi:glycosyltransferase involved in cell wall biosynthesis
MAVSITIDSQKVAMNQKPTETFTSDKRIRISVCMAVRNGTNFIEEQIASILPQLDETDELVIVDDASQDDTIRVIEEFHDSRIRIVRQEKNHGVIRSFGRALEEARGEIIFLTDHDDVWRQDKVEKFLEMFKNDPDITVVMSDMVIINAAGTVTAGPRFESKEFHPGLLHNFVRNRYHGSAMAFRRSILEYCLPFPSDIPIHDQWIGLVNQLIGKAGFIGEPLLFYRRHGKNDSPMTHAPLMQMIRWRWAVGKDLAWLWVRRRPKR